MSNTETTEVQEYQSHAQVSADVLNSGKVSAFALITNEENMARVTKFAETMASSKVTVPKHLQGSPGDCAAIIIQAAQWGMNPYAVAQKTHLVNGTLGYEAQLVNAVLQSMGIIEGEFTYEYKGNAGSIECRVAATPRGRNDLLWSEWLNERDVTTKNSPLWKTNPKQQMGYLQVKNWARKYYPGAILGVYTADELQDMAPKDVNQSRPRTGTQAGERAQASTVIDGDEDARNALIKELEDTAVKEGLLKYGEAWLALTKQQRVLVGTAEHERIKKMAEDSDKRIVEADFVPGAE